MIFLGAGDLAPDQEPIRRIERQAPARVRLDHRHRIVPEELIEIVEIAKCPRSHIRSVHGVTPYLINSRNLKFAVRIASGIRHSQRTQHSGSRQRHRGLCGFDRLCGPPVSRAPADRARHSRRCCADFGAVRRLCSCTRVEPSTSPLGPRVSTVRAGNSGNAAMFSGTRS